MCGHRRVSTTKILCTRRSGRPCSVLTQDLGSPQNRSCLVSTPFIGPSIPSTIPPLAPTTPDPPSTPSESSATWPSLFEAVVNLGLTLREEQRRRYRARIDERRAGRSTSVGLVVVSSPDIVTGISETPESAASSGSRGVLGMVTVEVSDGFEIGNLAMRSKRTLAWFNALQNQPLIPRGPLAAETMFFPSSEKHIVLVCLCCLYQADDGLSTHRGSLPLPPTTTPFRSNTPTYSPAQPS